MISIEVAGSVRDLGPEWDPLFAAGPGLQSRRGWFEATEAAAMAPGERAYWLLAREGTRYVGVLPMFEEGARQITSMTTPYTVLFQPLLAAGVDARAVGEAMGRQLRRWPLVRLEALDPGWAGFEPFMAGMRRAGFVPQLFNHFGNWHEDVAGVDWPAYLASRPGVLRETIRRRGRAVARDGTTRFEVARGVEGLPAAMAAYEDVYARSWKVPEPYPGFNAALLPRVAAMGALRLGVLWQGKRVLAAQYWTVLDGVATVLKLAHDDGAKGLSPGTVLTAHMIEVVLGEGGVVSLDFGRGDDEYKRGWAGKRRQRLGVLLANPRRLAGLVEVGRHWAGGVVRRFRGASGLTSNGLTYGRQRRSGDPPLLFRSLKQV